MGKFLPVFNILYSDPKPLKGLKIHFTQRAQSQAELVEAPSTQRPQRNTEKITIEINNTPLLNPFIDKASIDKYNEKTMSA